MDDHFPMFQEDSLIQVGEDKGNDVTCGTMKLFDIPNEIQWKQGKKNRQINILA